MQTTLTNDKRFPATAKAPAKQHPVLRIITRIFTRGYPTQHVPSQKVAIVVPLSSRPDLLPEEEVSIRHLTHFLGKYDRYFIAPAGVSVQRDGFRVLHFPRKFFGSAAAHNRLLMWPGFYRAFTGYQYILMYHLDSLVLSDEMARWCDAGLDYIGAPWIPCPDTPWVKEAQVGNGGFALMKVSSVLRVLHNRFDKEPATFWLDLLMRNNARVGPIFALLTWLQRFFPRARVINRPLRELAITEKPDIHGCNNDYFWSFSAVDYLPEFKVATVEEGLRFAFEAAPRSCFELNNRQMPFGCHAWAKFDRAFWEPHLLPIEENSPTHRKSNYSREAAR